MQLSHAAFQLKKIIEHRFILTQLKLTKLEVLVLTSMYPGSSTRCLKT